MVHRQAALTPRWDVGHWTDFPRLLDEPPDRPAGSGVRQSSSTWFALKPEDGQPKQVPVIMPLSERPVRCKHTWRGSQHVNRNSVAEKYSRPPAAAGRTLTLWSRPLGRGHSALKGFPLFFLSLPFIIRLRFPLETGQYRVCLTRGTCDESHRYSPLGPPAPRGHACNNIWKIATLSRLSPS